MNLRVKEACVKSDKSKNTSKFGLVKDSHKVCPAFHTIPYFIAIKNNYLSISNSGKYPL